MKRTNIFITFLLFSALTFLLSSCSDKTDEQMMKDEVVIKNDIESSQVEDKQMMKDESMMKDDKVMVEEEKIEKDEMMKDTKIWIYSDYSSEKLSNANWNIVLQFHANWCPSCVSLDKNLMWSEIPENLTILKVDYDKESDLKEKYSITMQHTSVLVDSDWNMIKKWSGSKNVEDILSQIN